MPVTNQSLIHFLILVLLFLTCVRFIFLTRVKEDTLALLPFVAFFIAVINVFVFCLSIQNMVLVALSFLVSLINVRAVIRLSSSLVIDHYGIPFMFSSVIFLAATVFVSVKIAEYTSFKVDSNKYEVAVTLEKYTGSFKEGFEQKSFPLKRNTLFVYKVESKKQRSFKDAEKIILFVPPLTTRFSTYEAFLYKLARDGWTVYCGEFFNSEANFTEDFRSMRFARSYFYFYERLFNRDNYEKLAATKKHVFIREYKELLKLTGATEDSYVVAVVDETPDFSQTLELNPLIDRAVNLNVFDSYKTPGFGPVENTELFSAERLGVQKDRGFFISNYLAQTVENYVEK